MKHWTLLLGIATCIVISGCSKEETSLGPPPYENSKNIIVDGSKITAKEYVSTYCANQPINNNTPYCTEARTQAQADRSEKEMADKLKALGL